MKRMVETAVPLELDHDAILYCAKYAFYRHQKNLESLETHADLINKYDWQSQVNSVYAEWALAIYLRIPWTGGDVKNLGADVDLAFDIDVKWTHHYHGELHVSRKLEYWKRYCLVVGDIAKDGLHFVGWATGEEYNDRGYYRKNVKHDVPWVKQVDLNHPKTLVSLIEHSRKVETPPTSSDAWTGGRESEQWGAF